MWDINTVVITLLFFLKNYNIKHKYVTYLKHILGVLVGSTTEEC